MTRRKKPEQETLTTASALRRLHDLGSAHANLLDTVIELGHLLSPPTIAAIANDAASISRVEQEMWLTIAQRVDIDEFPRITEEEPDDGFGDA